MDYDFNGQTFQVDYSKCDGSADWEVKVSDGKSNAVVTWGEKGYTTYKVVQVESGTTWSPRGEEEAMRLACNAVTSYSARAGITPVQACKALVDFIEQSGK